MSAFFTDIRSAVSRHWRSAWLHGDCWNTHCFFLL